MRRVLVFLFMGIGLAVALAGCEHKELCYDHDAHGGNAKFDIFFNFINDWESEWEGGSAWHKHWPDSFGISYDEIRPPLPTGVRVRIYRPEQQPEIRNYPIEGGKISLYKNSVYSLLFYNNDTEYIVFDELDDFATAKATTRSRSRETYRGNELMSKGGEVREYTVGQPDMLYGSYMESFNPMEVEGDKVTVLMHPLTYTYLVRYEFSHGLNYVADTKGALAGMARSVFLNSGRTGKEEATILYDCELKDFGAQALVKSFGVPNFPNPDYSRGEGQFGLTLEVTLKNGLRKNFDFDVTNQIMAQPHGGVIIVSGIEVPDEAGGSGGGGFDVDVDDWEGQEDIELPLDSIQ